ncbi:jg25043 [Pararge aegeria aegeria]|uniref:Jg25043 protein n=1 Tax=Pararge aegeria aegeria TaxID=348720 RepID=A0A8S4QXS0_9NEOP|nr:jg25043 [Pararge aegeria aegeria]
MVRDVARAGDAWGRSHRLPSERGLAAKLLAREAHRAMCNLFINLGGFPPALRVFSLLSFSRIAVKRILRCGDLTKTDSDLRPRKLKGKNPHIMKMKLNLLYSAKSRRICMM